MAMRDGRIRACDKCHGTGITWNQRLFRYLKCHPCRGTGEDAFKVCPYCESGVHETWCEEKWRYPLKYIGFPTGKRGMDQHPSRKLFKPPKRKPGPKPGFMSKRKKKQQ